jgi:nucleotide-binding universal stress UspA family protein
MFKNILLSVDLGEESSWKAALPRAVDIAAGENATLHLITVVPTYGMPIVGSFFPEDFEEKALAEAKSQLGAFIAKHIPGDVNAKGHVAHGVIYEEIMHAADKLGCDLIVLSSHRPELRDYLIGPNAARVVRHATQSVLVVRG